MVVNKPSLGDSCNHCGMCCIMQPCLLAQEVLNCHSGPCIALEDKDGKKLCGLVMRPAWYMFGEERSESETANVSVLFANALGLGCGCDSTIF